MRLSGHVYAALLFSALVFPSLFPTTAEAQSGDKLFVRLDSSESGIDFANYVIEDEVFNINTFIYAYNGGGTSVGDVDGDGLLDLYFTGTQSHTPNRLYRNLGNMRFEDITEKAGVGDTLGIRYGTAMVDIDGDGDLDIYVSKQQHPNRLYINDGKGRFTERAAEFGLDYCCSSTQTSFFDYDGDGDLDAYVGVNGDAQGEDYTNKGLPDRLFRNNGDGTFTDVSTEAGIYDEGYALSVSVGDLTGDGWPDIFITNDFVWADVFYVNNGDGTFTERTRERLRHTTEFGMGSDIGDINNDGHLDIIAADMLPEDHWRKMSHMGSQNAFSPLFDSAQMMRNNLHLNRGNGFFSEIAQLSGVDETDWSWTALFGDYDHDGHTDLYIANGYKRDVANKDVIQYFTRSSSMEMLKRVPSIKLLNYAYRNNGDLTFTKVSKEWGLDDYVNSNGGIYADLDNDGDLDLVVNNIDTLSMIYRNNAVEQKRGNWLAVKLEGEGKNRFGVGARVTVFLENGQKMVREFLPVRGYLSSTHTPLHFGFGNVEGEVKVEVRWPDGQIETRKEEVNQILTLEQDDADDVIEMSVQQPPLIVSLSPNRTGLDYSHTENNFDDFNRERLMPYKLSRNGPGVAIADIDGNGFDDVIFGSANTYRAGLYLQKSPGSFERQSIGSGPLADSAHEQMGLLLFDADGDGDNDLYIAHGSNETRDAEDPALQDRLLTNDGTGNFTLDTTLLPQMWVSTAAVVAADYDGDGDQDLFVGGRCVPGLYPDLPHSFLLENRNGRFVDVTDDVAPGLRDAGMVTSALFSDFSGDGRVDLVIGGHWSPIRFFENRGGTSFADVTASSGITDESGWWHSLSSGDFDNDGDIDYVAGNMGTNTRQTLQPTKEEPIRLYANDFDRNSSRDLIMSYYYNGTEFPARDRTALISQMGTYTKRRFPTYTKYATSPIDQVVDPDLLASAARLEATNLKNSWIENLGDGTFKVHDLPILAQVSPVFGTLVEDFDGDGNLDVLAMENFYAPDREVIRYDAGIGLLLLGDGRGGFTAVDPEAAGFLAPKDGRALAMINAGASGTIVVAVHNNAPIATFRVGHGSGKPGILSLADYPQATHAILEFEDGRSRRHEIHTGSGYLSQSSRIVLMHDGLEKVRLFDGTKEIETIER